MTEALDVKGLLRKKRDGGVLTHEESRALLIHTARGEIDEAALAALLASIWFHGMEPNELAGWTRGMVASGETLDLRAIGRPVVDKHSTGGIGDKVSIALAPLLAAVGCSVPMISGRGLGHTGGTLDKLEAVPGVRVDLSKERIEQVVREVGAVICAQTPTLCPADRVLYGLRDRVELVESLPLIASSIVSKKVAEGLDALVLDVKCGSGAFVQDPSDARALGECMTALGEAHGVRTSARLSWMGRPLGRAVGHALEVEECRDLLRGEGPTDLCELTFALGMDLLTAVDLFADREAARAALERAVASGDGAECLERMLRAQGATGEPLPVSGARTEFKAPRSGWLQFTDTRAIGYSVQELGSGRRAPGDAIDPRVGVVWSAREGDAVTEGDPLALLHHRPKGDTGAALAMLESAICIVDENPGPPPPLLLGH